MSVRCNNGFVHAFSYHEKQLRDPLLVILERSKTLKVDRISKTPTRKLDKPSDDIAQFLKNQQTKQEIESMHELCSEIRSALGKTRNLNQSRCKMLYPKYKNTIHSEHVENVIDRVNETYESCIIRKQKNKSENSTLEEQENLVKTPKTFIKSIHENYENLMKTRGTRVIDDVRHYTIALQNIDRRIHELSNAFQE